jgi:hypothetical protein
LNGEWIQYVYDQSDFRPDPGQFYIVLSPERINTTFQAHETRLAVYTDYSLSFGDMTITPGVRYISDGFTDHTYSAPRLAWDWSIDAFNHIWAMAGVYYQLPRYFDLSANPANTDLKSERAEHVSLGYSHHLSENVQFTAEIYHQRLENLIVFNDRTNKVATNTGEGYASGIDVALIKRMTHTTSGSISYSYSRSRRNDNLGQGEYNADYHRPHALSLSGAWEPNDRWMWSAKFTFASGRPSDGFMIHEDVLDRPIVPGEPVPLRYSKEYVTNNTERFDNYRSLSVRVDYRRRFGNMSVIAFLDVLNLFGQENDNSYAWNERRGINNGEGLGTALPLVGLKMVF